MKKKVLLAVMLAAAVFLCCACGMKDVQEGNAPEGIFAKYRDEYCGIVVVDTETGVMYWMSNSAYNAGTLTMLVEKDGRPKMYRGGDG